MSVERLRVRNRSNIPAIPTQTIATGWALVQLGSVAMILIAVKKTARVDG
jgi:hypothetical protein